MYLSLIPLAVLSLLSAGPAVRAELPPSRGEVFDPRPLSRPLYGTKAPSEDPETQQHFVEARDGVNLFVETWLPARKGSRVPPKRIPTILIMTPYVREGVEEYEQPIDGSTFIQYMTARGYAVAQHHVRGTGESGGCLEQTATNQIDDGARVVEYLGRDAPWSNGRIGMYGISYDAETQISTAGFGEAGKIKYLKALIPLSSVGGQYEYSFFDGVPYAGQALQSNAGYLVFVSVTPGQRFAPQHYPEKLTCQPEIMASSADQSGDMTPFWKEREYRPGAPRIDIPTLYVHGLRDFNVQPITLAGWFDRLPPTAPHKGIFGVWNHAFPYAHAGVEPSWARVDWRDITTAWFDRYLKGLPTGVEEWPPVQVQDSTGQWRVEPEFPTTGGPVGHLAVGGGGTLGARKPTGATSYLEVADEDHSAPLASLAVFETPELKAPLRITGQPVLDMWVTTDRPDGHIAAKIEVVGPDGPLRHQGSNQQVIATYGFRSLRHLEPLKHNHFSQERGEAPPTNEPIPVLVRFHPTDLVVPKGHSLRLTIAGSISYSRISEPSGLAPTITILHDCEHPSFLRFLMPRPDSRLLNVREMNEADRRLSASSAPRLEIDGGGIATGSVCGESPKRLSIFRPPR
ncbi:MAG: CocE/NonD family hydrolase [Actinomycetota bacterium]